MFRQSTGKGVRFSLPRTRARRWGAGCLLIPFGAVFAGFAILFGAIAFTAGAHQLDWFARIFLVPFLSIFVLVGIGGMMFVGKFPDPPLWVFGGFFFLVGAVLTTVGVHRLMAEAKLGRPTVRISVSPLLLGESFSLAYHQPVKGGGCHDGVTATLQMTEQATYRRGTNTHTVTHHAFEQEVSLLPPGKLIPGQELAAETQLVIPTDSMHSFKQSNNEIQWTIKVQTKIPRWPDYRSSYQLQVLPRAFVETGTQDTGDTTDGS